MRFDCENIDLVIDFEPWIWYDVQYRGKALFRKGKGLSMSVKRRDNKNRILRNGESQRPDGRYAYVYVDANGKQKFLYSWKLENTDKVPQGKRDCISLREKIKMLKKDMDDGIMHNDGKVTVLQLVQKYVGQKTGVRLGTKSGYNSVIKLLHEDVFGAMQIDRIKLSDAKEWFIRLQSDGKTYNTIRNIRGVVRPAFRLAVDDNMIRKNPFDFSLSTVISNDSKTRVSLTEDQELDFLEFVKKDQYYSKYYDGIYVLFNTGIRISELMGLTESDIDFDNGRLRITRQIHRKNKKEYYIEATKTSSGERYVPMTGDVMECFRRIIDKRNIPDTEPVVDGVSGFLFLCEDGMPMNYVHWDGYFTSICKKYNQTHETQMPNVTPHICRHTFCTKMAKKGMNPKILQYIMGHSNISVTLDVYTHINSEDAQKEMERFYME